MHLGETISSLLGLATNGTWWVLAGLGVWMLAHFQLYMLGEKVLGYVVTTVLAIVPLAIVAALVYLTVEKLFGKHWISAVGLFILALVGVFYFFLGGVKDGKVETKDEHPTVKDKIKALRNFGVLKPRPDDTVKTVMLLLGGAILVLGLVAVGLWAGWQLVQGSEAWGVGLTVAGLVVAVACRWPQRSWNLPAQAYSALANLSTK